MSIYFSDNENGIENQHFPLDSKFELFQDRRCRCEFPSVYPQYPFSPGRESADGFVYQVRFKYLSKYYLLGPGTMEEDLPSHSLLIKNGDYVCVEADRGLDIGVVTAKTPLDGFKESRLTMGRSRIHFGEYKHVLRRANQVELHAYSKKQQDEEKAAEVR
jgi:hypothetical protein